MCVASMQHQACQLQIAARLPGKCRGLSLGSIRFERQSGSESAIAPLVEGTIGQRFSWLERPQASAGVKHQAASADAQGSVGLIAAEPEQSQLVTGQDYT